MRCSQFSKGADGHDYCVMDLCGVRTECKSNVKECKDSYMRGLLEATMETEDREKYFEERTAMHIDLVKKAAEKIAQTGYVDGDELIQRAKVHDASKFDEPERTPYI